MTRVLRPPKRIEVTLNSTGRPRIVRLNRNFDHVLVVKVMGESWIVLIYRDHITGDWFLERIFD